MPGQRRQRDSIKQGGVAGGKPVSCSKRGAAGVCRRSSSQFISRREGAPHSRRHKCENMVTHNATILEQHLLLASELPDYHHEPEQQQPRVLPQQSSKTCSRKQRGLVHNKEVIASRAVTCAGECARSSISDWEATFGRTTVLCETSAPVFWFSGLNTAATRC
ncbi:hypothetical protein PR048_016704 [Dryococelus australis]|uniref:Uncharacterized protein n=1 Tax=Dryococelus australis TaxID=614101 RepID=A0ABQ9H809_9NEOP|nr:hypothetical protein PR048_016704 [Dryococelus australis]